MPFVLEQTAIDTCNETSRFRPLRTARSGRELDGLYQLTESLAGFNKFREALRRWDGLHLQELDNHIDALIGQFKHTTWADPRAFDRVPSGIFCFRCIGFS
jgi:hypothetical protein